jgi:hypothetical protein
MQVDINNGKFVPFVGAPKVHKSSTGPKPSRNRARAHDYDEDDGGDDTRSEEPSDSDSSDGAGGRKGSQSAPAMTADVLMSHFNQVQIAWEAPPAVGRCHSPDTDDEHLLHLTTAWDVPRAAHSSEVAMRDLATRPLAVGVCAVLQGRRACGEGSEEGCAAQVDAAAAGGVGAALGRDAQEPSGAVGREARWEALPEFRPPQDVIAPGGEGMSDLCAGQPETVASRTTDGCPAASKPTGQGAAGVSNSAAASATATAESGDGGALTARVYRGRAASGPHSVLPLEKVSMAQLHALAQRSGAARALDGCLLERAYLSSSCQLPIPTAGLLGAPAAA